jgi:hypothetical protein
MCIASALSREASVNPRFQYEMVAGRLRRRDTVGFFSAAQHFSRVVAIGQLPMRPNPKKPTGLKTKSASRSAFFNSRVVIGLALCSVGLLLALAGLSKSATGTPTTTVTAPTLNGTWRATGRLANARFYHTATLLPNGKILVAGGYDNKAVYLASAELYDPASRTWTTTGRLASARFNHQATLLPNGKVLVSGGYGSAGSGTSAELYDPASGTWSKTGLLANDRSGHYRHPLGRRQGARRRRSGTQRLFPSSRQRGTLRSGERELVRDRQPQHRPLGPYGDAAPRRQGTRRRRLQLCCHWTSRERGTLRSGDRHLVDHRQPRSSTL